MGPLVTQQESPRMSSGVAAGPPVGGLVDVIAHGAIFKSKPVLFRGVAMGTPVTNIHIGRSIVAIGPGGYLHAT